MMVYHSRKHSLQSWKAKLPLWSNGSDGSGRLSMRRIAEAIIDTAITRVGSLLSPPMDGSVCAVCGYGSVTPVQQSDTKVRHWQCLRCGCQFHEDLT